MQALSKRNDDPATASRPYDVTATASSWAREPPHSCSRPRSTRSPVAPHIYAEIAGARSRATRTTSRLPTPRAGAPPARSSPPSSRPARGVDDVTHINAHATSTPVGDIAEYKALLAVFGDRVHDIPVSATKAATGHLLGGTGALEAVFTILAVKNRMAPPTINLTEQDPEIPLSTSATTPGRSGMARSSRSRTRSGSAATTR